MLAGLLSPEASPWLWMAVFSLCTQIDLSFSMHAPGIPFSSYKDTIPYCISKPP